VGIEGRDYWLDVPEYRRLSGTPPRRVGRVRSDPTAADDFRDVPVWQPGVLDVEPAGGGIPDGIDLRGMLRTAEPLDEV
jgi:hypothetical protein